MKQIIGWFSCGAASATSIYYALKKYPEMEIIYCDTGSEHPDNYRFLKDCEKLYNKKIKILKSEKYKDTWDVFQKTNYLVGPQGARCTAELKKKIRYKIQENNSIQIFGFTKDEEKRLNRLQNENFEIKICSPLIERKLSKYDCLFFLKVHKIELPVMYKLGYKNNNCIGCPKGGKGYWNKIRKDFPDIFNKMAKEERRLNVAINSKTKNGVKRKIFLDELDPNEGNYKNENISCGMLCERD